MMNTMSDGERIYAEVCSYLAERGWRREEAESGWWMKDGTEEMMLGDALEVQLDEEEIDQRVMTPGEPHIFWGRP